MHGLFPSQVPRLSNQRSLHGATNMRRRPPNSRPYGSPRSHHGLLRLPLPISAPARGTPESTQGWILERLILEWSTLEWLTLESTPVLTTALTPGLSILESILVWILESTLESTLESILETSAIPWAVCVTVCLLAILVRSAMLCSSRNNATCLIPVWVTHA